MSRKSIEAAQKIFEAEDFNQTARIDAVLEYFWQTPSLKVINTALKAAIQVHKRNGEKTESGNRARKQAKMVVVTGESGAGKTTLVQESIRASGAFDGYGTSDGCPWLIEAELEAMTLTSLVGGLMDSLPVEEVDGSPVRKTLPTTATGLSRIVLAQMRQREIDYLIIDEAHDIFELANEQERKKFTKFLKTASQSNTWPITIILVGCPEIIKCIERDPELSRRALPVVIESLHPLFHSATVSEKLLKPLAKLAEIPMGPQAQDVASRLIVAAGAQIGECVEMAKEAVINAIVAEAGAVGSEHFSMMYSTAKSADDAVNPFLCEDYLDIPAGRLAMTTARIAQEQLEKMQLQEEFDRLAKKGRRHKRKADRK